MSFRLTPWAVAGALSLTAGLAAAEAQTAAMLSNTCAPCHGTLGASAGLSMPALAGQSKAAIVEAMKEFKSGERPGTVMGRLAKGYSDADVEAIAGFFAKQKPPVANQTVDAGKADKGGLLQEKHCGRCHLEDGKEGKDNSPVLAGQWLKYLQLQMDDYVSGRRKMGEKMAEKVKPLSKDDLEAILHFYASVK